MARTNNTYYKLELENSAKLLTHWFDLNRKKSNLSNISMLVNAFLFFHTSLNETNTDSNWKNVRNCPEFMLIKDLSLHTMKIIRINVAAGRSAPHRWIPTTKASDAELWCFFIYAWTNGWVNNCDASDLRRHRAHYDVIVIRVAKILNKNHPILYVFVEANFDYFSNVEHFARVEIFRTLRKSINDYTPNCVSLSRIS